MAQSGPGGVDQLRRRFSLDKRGKPYSKKFKNGESAHIIAGSLLKQRFHDRGGDKKQFNRPLVYPPMVY